MCFIVSILLLLLVAVGSWWMVLLLPLQWSIYYILRRSINQDNETNVGAAALDDGADTWTWDFICHVWMYVYICLPIFLLCSEQNPAAHRPFTHEPIVADTAANSRKLSERVGGSGPRDHPAETDFCNSRRRSRRRIVSVGRRHANSSFAAPRGMKVFRWGAEKTQLWIINQALSKYESGSLWPVTGVRELAIIRVLNSIRCIGIIHWNAFGHSLILWASPVSPQQSLLPMVYWDLRDKCLE